MSGQPLEWERLRDAAIGACGHAYRPYSGFPVGSAVLAHNGIVYTGCNVENVCYSLTNCAERTAIFKMISELPGRAEIDMPVHRLIRAVVVYTPTAAPNSPCGACRQVIAEFGSEAIVRCYCDSAEVLETTLAQLLPSTFDPKDLRQHC